MRNESRPFPRDYTIVFVFAMAVIAPGLADCEPQPPIHNCLTRHMTLSRTEPPTHSHTFKYNTIQNSLDFSVFAYPNVIQLFINPWMCEASAGTVKAYYNDN